MSSIYIAQIWNNMSHATDFLDDAYPDIDSVEDAVTKLKRNVADVGIKVDYLVIAIDLENMTVRPVFKEDE